jgi:hypothetical protein
MHQPYLIGAPVGRADGCLRSEAILSDDFESDTRLGPAPALSIATLADLGVSDAMIARYFAIDLGRLYTLQKGGRLAEQLPSGTGKDGAR